MAKGDEKMPKSKDKYPVSSFALFSASSELVQNNLGTFAILYIIPLLANLGFLRGGGRYDTNRWSGFSTLPSGYALGALIGFGFILAVIVFVVSLFVKAMTYGLELDSSRGKKPNIEQLLPYAKKYWLRIFGLLVLIGILVVLGLILFIVPGIIAIRRYFLAPYIMIDKNASIRDSLRQSAAMTKPYSGSIYGILGVMILISLPSALPVFGWVVTFVLSILYSVAPALRYQELKKLS